MKIWSFFKKLLILENKKLQRIFLCKKLNLDFFFEKLDFLRGSLIHKMSIRPKESLSASYLLSNSNTVYTRLYAVVDDGHLTIVFLLLPHIQRQYLSNSFVLCLLQLVLVSCAFKSVAILLAPTQESPLTNLYK